MRRLKAALNQRVAPHTRSAAKREGDDIQVQLVTIRLGQGTWLSPFQLRGGGRWHTLPYRVPLCHNRRRVRSHCLTTRPLPVAGLCCSPSGTLGLVSLLHSILQRRDAFGTCTTDDVFDCVSAASLWWEFGGLAFIGGAGLNWSGVDPPLSSSRACLTTFIAISVP